MPKLCVRFGSLRNCFVNLPPSWTHIILEQGYSATSVVLELSWHDASLNSVRKTYVGWAGGSSNARQAGHPRTHKKNAEILEMDTQFGLAMGLKDGQEVEIAFKHDVPNGNSVEVEPFSADDWEIVELHAGLIEQQFLNQIQIVHRDQTINFWIHGQTIVQLRVVNTDPKASCIKLGANAEVYIKPKVRESALISRKTDLTDEDSGAESKPLFYIPCRLLPAEYFESEKLSDLRKNPSTILMHPQDSDLLKLEKEDIVIVEKLSRKLASKPKLPEQDESENNLELQLPKAICVRVHFDEECPPGHVVMNSQMRRNLNATAFEKLRIFVSPTGPCTIKKIKVFPVEIGTDRISSAKHQSKAGVKPSLSLAEWIKKNNSSLGELVLTNLMVINVSPKNEPSLYVQVQFGSSEQESNLQPNKWEEYAVMNGDIMRQSNIFEDTHVTKYSEDQLPQLSQFEATKLGGIKEQMKNGRTFLKSNISRNAFSEVLQLPAPGGLLVYGGAGSGKTTFCRTLLHELEKDRNALTHLIVVDCSDLVKERPATVKEKLQEWYNEASWYSPSLVFFDNLDRLVPAELEHQNSTNSRNIAECFVEITKRMTRNQQIIVVASSLEPKALHPQLLSNHLFSETIHLSAPGKLERREILELLIAEGPEILRREETDIDVTSIAGSTEGYMASDLRVLVQRALHNAAIRNVRNINLKTLNDLSLNGDRSLHQHVQITQEDFEQARKDYVPVSLRGVKLESSSVEWSDIGGLKETKKVLLETLEWPTKYAPIFANCPLRLRSGLLLYGFPGCGKTLLASAVAKEWPEILNKYIGASEKSVRDLFERAQAAKPCVLFFDEFDSIAPKRGHDSTGVTDRVVNQLLTQMDGAEGLDGVYVLAATSRPDLIDSALLRPGRLDKSLFCGIPDVVERLEILQAVSKKMSLHEEVELLYWAEKCIGYSGADLQGFVYNAHLEAIHDTIKSESLGSKKNSDQSNSDQLEFIAFDANLDNTAARKNLTLEEKGRIAQRLELIRGEKQTRQTEISAESNPLEKTGTDNHAKITNENLRKSFESTRASINEKEFRRLKAIYDEFVNGRSGEMPNGTGSHEVGKRATLA
ncbi:AAA-domain-containing protein [Basidiobolus meristosporus CBS 931.73]|uniref:Peroxisomal ATPase PEX1 n=1 Tax=Basidiobolus meristosporus CBS 931.73 TaxID=1314790 RepID=A0A1Y1Z5G5_9FUNG|nr:AAA-domain-containing protein [Basidiobolus meristosporus CBS 931.73]|eukprot:ORY05217.1 AAA-domain-containing protein [Basidiobolus meristosporus CBS 931.73]